MLGLCVMLLVRYQFPWQTASISVMSLWAVLLVLVPRCGDDCCVRIGVSVLLLSFSLIWLSSARGRVTVHCNSP